MPVETIGLVGLGNMGVPMARNLAAAGFALVVRDLDRARQQAVVDELGCAPGNKPADFSAADAVITMLPTGADVRDVLLDWGLGDALAPGTVVVDMSSSDPIGTRELGAALAPRLPVVDAPVSGGVPKAETGTLSIMVGADDNEAVERVTPVFEALGERLFRTGPLGSGHAMKALNNYVAAAGYTAAAEALLVGAHFGLDPATIVSVLNASTGRNFNTETNFALEVLPRTFASGFTLGLLAKDVGIAADLAAAIEVEAPLCQETARLWREAEAGEGAAADHTAAIRHWERANGIELPVRPAQD